MKKRELPDGFDFGGWATVYGITCADGRTIKHGAFTHLNGARIPLVWQHMHDDPDNILGHAILEHSEEGVYAYGKFNETKAGATARILVQGEDIQFLSIWANHVVEAKNLVHTGEIKELSLVISGANPGAKIDNVSFAHNDEYFESEGEVFITTGRKIDALPDNVVKHEDLEDEDSAVDDDNGKTLSEVFNTLTDEQKDVVYAIVAEALTVNEDSDVVLEQSDIKTIVNNDEEEEQGETMKRVFENSGNGSDAVTVKKGNGSVLSHSDVQKIFTQAQRLGSLRDAVTEFMHAGTYGIDNISNLFPDATPVSNTPDWLMRPQGWVGTWMSAVRHTGFSRVKSMYADITADEARAKGYTTGDQKLNEVFAVLKRETTPQTMYKLQKLDRDDILDITDFNVVSWLKAEMRMMLDEEIARACLVGDGRTWGTDDDAVDPSKIRPVLTDDAVYAPKTSLAVTVTDPDDIIEAIILARNAYRGTGSPMAFMSPTWLTTFLLIKDTTGRRIYRNVQELAAELRVSQIVETEVLEGVQRNDAAPFIADLITLILNPKDYVIGADKGGTVNFFDDFDIDYNQHKYLIETRISGALVKPKSCLVIERKTA